MTRIQVTVPGFIDPTLLRRVGTGTLGTVTDDRNIELDDGDVLKYVGKPPHTPGTRVEVTKTHGHLYAEPLAEKEDRKAEQAAKKEAREARRDERKNEARRVAEAFWSEYDIPVAHDVRIKIVRSGLLRGSNGTGRNRSTVEHLYLTEAFSEGRLTREANSYLCDPKASIEDADGIVNHDGDGEAYVPKVTCKRCLEMMERWKSDASDSTE